MEAKKLAHSLNGEQLNQRFVETIVITPPSPAFAESKDNLNEFLLLLERYADVAERDERTWVKSDVKRQDA